MTATDVDEVRVTVVEDPYLSPEQVCELIPGMTKGNLAQIRHDGRGPEFRYATPRVIVYRRSDVIAWIEAQAHSRTDQPITRDRVRAVA